MRPLQSALLALCCVFLAATSRAVENIWDYSVQLSAVAQTSPASITLQWPQDTNGVPQSYTIYRKAPAATDWGSGTMIAGNSTSYRDSGVSPGTAYEYRVVKAAGGYNGYGYIHAGIAVSLVDRRGTVVLVVDNSMAGSLSFELGRLQRDLAGDGWTVVRHDVSRSASAASVKALIVGTYNADPANVKSVFLFGRVPVPYSGQFTPDGHSDHVGAWPADVYYGDVYGNWSDSSVNYTLAGNAADTARMSNYPGDGKFDHSQIPSPVELEVGRVDLSSLPGKTAWNSPPTFASETELLRKYLQKDHAYRNRLSNPPRRAIIGDYTGARNGAAYGASGFRSFAPLVGAENIRDVNREFSDQRGVWLPQAAQNDYLFAYASGAGSYVSIGGIGSGSYNSADTVEFVSSRPRSVFHLFYGSWFGDWDVADSILRAPLATDHGLTSAYSGNPHWFMHPLGLGETVGYTARLTQNNTGLYQNQSNRYTNHVHIALMGDPTLRLYPVVPPGDVSGSVNSSNVSLAWPASNDNTLAGYHVYRGSSVAGPFTRLTSSPTNALNFSDSAGSSSAIYQVRAVKLETSPSGTFYNSSQGKFWPQPSGSGGSSTTPPITPAGDTNAPIVSFTSPGSGATVSGPTVGVSANASDAVGVAGVQFKVDGANFDTEDYTPPFAATLNSTTLTNGGHTLSAVARDAAGNTATATLSFTVNNTTTPPATTPIAGETIWFDDALPNGATGSGSGGDGWNWVTANPAPFSGTRAHQSTLSNGLHEHFFGWGDGLTLAAGDKIVTYVYLDPANVPAEIMLSFKSDSWEHRAYWGADRISFGTNGTASRYRVGNLPTAGQWVRLEIPASALGLEGHTVTMMGFSQFDGRATWDKTGKAAAGSATAPVVIPPVITPPIVTPPGTTSPITTPASQTVWFDDALPAGASGNGSGGDGWNWVSANPAPFSGSRAHQSSNSTGLHEHTFGWGAGLAVGSGDVIYTYVYIDPASPPSQIMLSFYSNSWEHRAYWGADRSSYGTNGTPSRYRIGDLPAAGQWVRLEIPAGALGLEGHTLTMMSFSQFDGRATWDVTGKASAASTTTTVSTPVTSTTPAGADTFVWLDDAVPSGATGAAVGAEGWNWVTSNPTPFSGTRAHQSILAAGLHEHYFAWGATMSVGVGEKLYAYVYLDPANPPTEIMLSWNADNWEHRAYWGADRINSGTPGSASRYRAGSLPPTGQWVRLEVPASAVGLEGRTVSAMGFTTFDGRVTFDKSGKSTP